MGRSDGVEYEGSPLIEVCEFELHHNPGNYFAEIEQADLAPSHLVPGISVSPARMLQARLFSDTDAQRYHLASTTTRFR